MLLLIVKFLSSTMSSRIYSYPLELKIKTPYMLFYNLKMLFEIVTSAINVLIGKFCVYYLESKDNNVLQIVESVIYI